MQNRTHIPTWLIGGVSAWLVYVLTLSLLHISLLSQWDVPFSIRIYTLEGAGSISFIHLLLLGMVAPAFFTLDALAFLHVHLPWLDAAIYNWRTMVLLSSFPVLVVGMLLTMHDRRMKLAGAIIGLLILGGSLLFVLDRLLAR